MRSHSGFQSANSDHIAFDCLELGNSKISKTVIILYVCAYYAYSVQEVNGTISIGSDYFIYSNLNLPVEN